MKKYICLLLAVGMMGAAFAACEKDETPETSSEISSSSEESSTPEEVPVEPLTQEEWEALAQEDLFANVTIRTTQIDSYYKTVGETLVVDGYMYGRAWFYDLETDALVNTQNWGKAELASLSWVTPKLEDYAKIAYSDEKGVYYYTEEKIIDVEDTPWHYTVMEWTVSGGKIVDSYTEFWYMDEVNGVEKKVTGSIRTEYSAYGTTVAPEGV